MASVAAGDRLGAALVTLLWKLEDAAHGVEASTLGAGLLGAAG